MHAPTRTHAEKAAPGQRRAQAWFPVSAGRRGHLGAALAAAGVQAKLRVAEPADASEKEADRIAEAVLSMPEPGVAKAPVEPPSPSSRLAVRRATAPSPAPAEGLPDQVASRIEGLSKGGDPLPPAVRGYFEPRFGQDFSRVRIHTGAEPARASDDIGARAFTVGEHISFAAGAYEPHTRAGRRLLAHELTHVVQQQRESKREIRRDVVGDIGDAIAVVGDAVSDPMSLVRRYAPALVPLLEKGPLGYLQGLLGGAFDEVAASVKALLPAGGAAPLLAGFGALSTRGLGIVESLKAGDCGPFLAAIGDLQAFLTEAAGEAWNGLTALLSPVGDFFSDLWASTGAPAIAWLSAFAGDLWTDITDLGEEIWSYVEPLGAAWGWVKGQLFGSEGDAAGDSQGGITGWITRKASEAWEWVKAQTRPVWEPLSEAVQVVRELVPPAFVRELGESLSGLGASLDGARASIGTEGEHVAENREALAGALPSVQQVLALVRGGIVSARVWLTEKIGVVSGQVSAFLARLGAVSLLSSLGGTLSWLDGLTTDLSTWAGQTAGGVFDGVLAAFDIVSPYLETLLGIVRQVITVASDLMQLPSLVLGELWGLVPECLRAPIEDFLLNQILGRIPVFSSLLAIPDVWAKVEAVALQILRQVFVDGDLAGAAWTYFTNVLALIGIPPDLVVRILAKAATAIGDILTDPIGFLLHLVQAAVQGFSQFFENIGSHLLDGVAGWLFGAVGEAGITIPQDFSLRSILVLVFEILDVSVDRVFERLEKKVGPDVVARLRGALDMATGVWSWVSVLVNEGISGLWRELQEQLSGLWSTVLSSVATWLTEVVIVQSTLWLLSFVDISGLTAIVNTLIAVYRAVESAVAYLNDMLLIVDRFLDGVVGVAKGDVDIAAGFLEGALAKSLPVAIGFLAYQCGLGNVSSHLREMVEAVREMVDKGIDWLIDRALQLGSGVLDLLRRGGAAIAEWWNEKERFKLGAEDHTLFFAGEGDGAVLMANSQRKTFRDFLDTEVKPKVTDEKGAAVLAEIEEQFAIIEDIKTRTGGSFGKTGGASITEAFEKIATELSKLEFEAVPTKIVEQGVELLKDGSVVGKKVVAKPLTRNPGGLVGTKPYEETPTWNAVKRRVNKYVRGHLLNHHLFGAGKNENLVPITMKLNSKMSSAVEEPVKEAVFGKDKTVSYTVEFAFGTHSEAPRKIPEELTLPTSVHMQAQEMEKKGTDWEPARVLVDQTFPHELPNDNEPIDAVPRLVRLSINHPASPPQPHDPDGKKALMHLSGVAEQRVQSLLGHTFGSLPEAAAAVNVAKLDEQWAAQKNDEGQPLVHLDGDTVWKY